MTNEDDFPLHARLEYSGPRAPVYDSAPREYYCTYCFTVLTLLQHEIRVCQALHCIQKAIADRRERIWEIQLSIPRVHGRLREERTELTRQIDRLKQDNSTGQLLAQYESLLFSLNANLKFYAEIDRVDQILALNEQIKELVSRLRRPSFSGPFRRELWERDRGLCYLCHKRIEHWDGLLMHVDHIKARSKGGSDAEHNLRIAHPERNLKKGDRELSARRMQAILRELRKTDAEIARGRLF